MTSPRTPLHLWRGGLQHGIVALGLLVLLALLKPIQADIAFVAAFIYQLYVPRFLGYDFTWNRALLRSDLLRVALFVCVTFPLYGLGFWMLQKYLAHEQGYAVAFMANVDPKLLWSLVVNIFLIALPEEFFYRGFLQSQVSRWPAIIAINGLFTLGHFVGEYNPARLLPFFPGLLFAWLAYKGRGSLVGAITFHGLCNMFSEWLASSVYWVKS